MNKNLNERTLRIRELEDASSNTQNLTFKKLQYPCKIITLQIDYLIYRLDNTRTLSKQPEYIKKHDLNNDYFDSDRQENPEVQASQHELLSETLLEDSSSLGKAFDMKGGQDEPLEITSEGVMINGNRRLCLMRTRSFDSIECKVVSDPNLRGRDKEIEASLDIAVSGKVGYDWASQGLGILSLKADGLSDNEIREYKGMLTVAEVSNLAGATSIARYGLELRGCSEEWSKVRKSEQIYLDAAAKTIPDEMTKKASDLSVILIDAATTDAIGGRAYDLVKDHLKFNSAGLKLAHKWFPANSVPEVDDVTGETITSGGFDEDKLRNEILLDQDKIDSYVEELKEVIEDERDAASGRGARRRLIVEIDKAFKASQKAQHLSTNTSHDTDGVIEKIAKIDDHLKAIIANIENN